MTDWSLTPVVPKWFQPGKASFYLVDCLPFRHHFKPDRQFREIMGQTPDLRYLKMREPGESLRFRGETKRIQEP
jgi:hypothetical protein